MLKRSKILLGLICFLTLSTPVCAHAEWKVPVSGESGGSQNIGGGGGGEVVHLDEVVIIRNPVLYNPKVTYVKSINAALADAGETMYFLPQLDDFPVDLADTIANQKDHNFAIVYDGYFDPQVKLNNVDPINKAGTEADKQQRVLTSKRVYSATKNSRCLNLLGYDLLLANETPYITVNGGQITCKMNSIPVDDKSLSAQTVIMDLYKAMGVYEWDIQFAYSKPADEFDINKSPIYQYIGTLTSKDYEGGVDTSELETWVVASRSNAKQYWDRFLRDGIMDGGTHNIQDRQTASKNKDEQIDNNSYEEFIYIGSETSVPFQTGTVDNVDTFQFFQLARAIMTLYGEPMLTEEEYNNAQNRFAAYMPDGMTKDEFDATMFMLSKGIVSVEEIDPDAHVKFDTIEDWLLRIADPDSRIKYDYSEGEVNILTENGYTDVDVEVVPEATATTNKCSTTHEYDVLIEVNKFTQFVIRTTADQDTNPNYHEELDPNDGSSGTPVEHINPNEGPDAKELKVNTKTVAADYVDLMLETADKYSNPFKGGEGQRPQYTVELNDYEGTASDIMAKRVVYRGVEKYGNKSYYHFVIPQNSDSFQLGYDLAMANANCPVGYKIEPWEESDFIDWGSVDKRFMSNIDKYVNSEGRVEGGVYKFTRDSEGNGHWTVKTFEDSGFSNEFFDKNYQENFQDFKYDESINSDPDEDQPLVRKPKRVKQGLSKDNSMATCSIEIKSKFFTPNNLKKFKNYMIENTKSVEKQDRVDVTFAVTNKNKFDRIVYDDKSNMTPTIMMALACITINDQNDKKLHTGGAEQILNAHAMNLRVVQNVINKDVTRIEIVCKQTEMSHVKNALSMYAAITAKGDVNVKASYSLKAAGAAGYYRHEDNSMLISYNYLKEKGLLSDLTETDKGIVLTSTQRLINVYLISSDGGKSGNIMVGNTMQKGVTETLYAEINDVYYINVRACIGWANNAVSVPCSDSGQELKTKDFVVYLGSNDSTLGMVFNYNDDRVQTLPQFENVGLNTLTINQVKTKDIVKKVKASTFKMIPLASSYALAPYIVILGEADTESASVDHLFVMHSKDYMPSFGPPFDWNSKEGQKLLQMSKSAVDKYKELTSFDIKVPDGYVLMCYQLRRQDFQDKKPFKIFNSDNKKDFNLVWYTKKFYDVTGKTSCTAGWVYNPKYFGNSAFVKGLEWYNDPKMWTRGFTATDTGEWVLSKREDIKPILPIFAHYTDKASNAKLYDANVNKSRWVTGEMMPINTWSAKMSSKLESNAEKKVTVTAVGKTEYKALDEGLTSANIEIIPAPSGVFFTANEQELVSLSEAGQGALFYGTCKIKADNTSVTINNFVTSLSANAQAVRTFVGTTQATYCALPEKMSASNIQQLLNKAESTLNAAYEDPVGAVDWAAYSFDRLINNLDSWSTIAWIFILNVLPRVGMFLFMILIFLSVIKDVPFWKKFCQTKFDIYSFLTFEHQTVDSINTVRLLIYSCIGLALFMMIMDGHLFNFILWTSRMFIHLYQT